MALFNYATKEITLKIVYYGPGLSGKTTNIQHLHSALNPANKGKLLSLATESDRTLFFDFLPVELGKIKDFSIRFQLYTVPGQVRYNATRKVVLKGADAVVFVADSQQDMREQNIESIENMRENLISNNINPDEIPVVLQFNKRDLKNILTIAELNDDLNKNSAYDIVEAEAINGKGVEDTFQLVTRLVLKDIARKHKIEIQPAPLKEELKIEEETVDAWKPELASPLYESKAEAEGIEALPGIAIEEEVEQAEPEYELEEAIEVVEIEKAEPEQEPKAEPELHIKKEYETLKKAYREPLKESKEDSTIPSDSSDKMKTIAGDVSILNAMLSDLKGTVISLKTEMIEIKESLNSIRQIAAFREDKQSRELRTEQGSVTSLKTEMIEIKESLKSIRESAASGEEKHIAELRREHRELHKILKDIAIILKNLKIKKRWFSF